MTALLKLAARDLGHFLWRGAVISGLAQYPALYGEFRAQSRPAASPLPVGEGRRLRT